MELAHVSPTFDIRHSTFNIQHSTFDIHIRHSPRSNGVSRPRDSMSTFLVGASGGPDGIES